MGPSLEITSHKQAYVNTLHTYAYIYNAKAHNLSSQNLHRPTNKSNLTFTHDKRNWENEISKQG